MQATFESGRIIDLVLLLVAIETIVAILYFWRKGRPATGLAANLAAGACLLLAIRAAVIGTDWIWVMIWVAFSLPFHILDVRSRWPSRSAPVGDDP